MSNAPIPSVDKETLREQIRSRGLTEANRLYWWPLLPFIREHGTERLHSVTYTGILNGYHARFRQHVAAYARDFPDSSLSRKLQARPGPQGQFSSSSSSSSSSGGGGGVYSYGRCCNPTDHPRRVALVLRLLHHALRIIPGHTHRQTDAQAQAQAQAQSALTPLTEVVCLILHPLQRLDICFCVVLDTIVQDLSLFAELENQLETLYDAGSDTATATATGSGSGSGSGSATATATASVPDKKGAVPVISSAGTTTSIASLSPPLAPYPPHSHPHPHPHPYPYPPAGPGAAWSGRDAATGGSRQ